MRYYNIRIFTNSYHLIIKMIQWFEEEITKHNTS